MENPEDQKLLDAAISSVRRKLLSRSAAPMRDEKRLSRGATKAGSIEEELQDKVASVLGKTAMVGLEKEGIAPPLEKRRTRRKKDTDTAGPGWFHMPKRKPTTEELRDLKMLQLQQYTDPKKHYRAADSKKIPEFFQMGTVIEGAQEFYSGRVPRRKRGVRLADEFLNNDGVRAYAKRTHVHVQEASRRGGKKDYRKKTKKYKTWKG